MIGLSERIWVGFLTTARTRKAGEFGTSGQTYPVLALYRKFLVAYVPKFISQITTQSSGSSILHDDDGPDNHANLMINNDRSVLTCSNSRGL